MVMGWVGESTMFKDVQSRSTFLQVAIFLIFFQLFVD